MKRRRPVYAEKSVRLLGWAVSGESIVFQLFIVFAGAAVLATVALFARQALVVAYIVLGAL
ncbi:MAG TPA: hypothetical protein ENJ35_00510, partial [Gammaproteobacteria bacterium]|nr:hypothetical protein [Gammaproteobacteria bacterium]